MCHQHAQHIHLLKKCIFQNPQQKYLLECHAVNKKSCVQSTYSSNMEERMSSESRVTLNQKVPSTQKTTRNTKSPHVEYKKQSKLLSAIKQRRVWYHTKGDKREQFKTKWTNGKFYIQEKKKQAIFIGGGINVKKPPRIKTDCKLGKKIIQQNLQTIPKLESCILQETIETGFILENSQVELQIKDNLVKDVFIPGKQGKAKTTQQALPWRMSKGMTIMVTGGAGYIGSHSVIELVEAGYDIVVIDNLVNASMESIRRVEKIVGKQIPSYSVDLLNKDALDEVFKKHKISAVIHFAGLKAVGESCELPLLYYKTNVGGTTNLLEVMEANGVYDLVFSSSATVYGTPQFLPLTESHPVGGCTNPYGKTKFMIEQILQDISSSNKKWNIVILRYFNPVGSHKSGTIGEDPQGVPNNLMPYIAQVAVGRREFLSIYGGDYDTPDGTGVRDYIHVVDLAQGHVAAIKKLEEKCGLKIYNLGTGQGYSVLDMAKAFEKASGKKIPYKVVERRAGDIGSCYSDTSLAAKELGWTAKKGLDEMCEDLWRWQSQNPQGYNTVSS